MFALWLPVLLLMVSFVVDVGNWFEHKRHLQMQADSAALAAALDLRSPCSDTVVQGTAASYGGGDYNQQIQNRQAAVHMRINSQTWFNQSSPVDSTAPTSPPCTSLMVDVKLTEADLPWYFKLASVPFINAHARVGLFTVDTYTGSLPLAVPEVDPKKVLVQFIDEDTGDILASKQLTKGGLVNGSTVWDNSAAPVPVAIDRKNIGVRVVVTNSNSTTCTDPYVDCYDAGSPNGLVYLRGWSGAGSGAQQGQPLARDVSLQAGTCTDAYFSASAADCTIGVRAVVDFGPLPPANARLVAVVNGKSTNLTYDSASGAWSSPLTLTVPAGSGPVPVTLNWEERSGTVGTTACTNGKPCTGTFGVVQRSFAGSDARSGPLRSVQILEGGVPGADSIQRCSSALTSCTHNLVVKIGLPPALSVAQSVNDPVVELRFAGGGSQSQGLDCDPGDPKYGNPAAPNPLPNFNLFEVELQWGCRPGYQPNQGTACPANATALWATPNPPAWQCVANQTGQYANKIPQGLNPRILCPPTDPQNGPCADPQRPTSCTHPNNWSSFPTGLPPDDPRIVQLFVTRYGAFNGSGSFTVPITRFATFYVTGWSGSGGAFTNPCQGNGDDPAADRTIVGHFIKYIDVLGSSSGTTICDFADSAPCVPVMVE